MKKISSVCAIAAALALSACGADKAKATTDAAAPAAETAAKAADAAKTADTAKQATDAGQTEIQKQSYTFGVKVGSDIKQYIEKSNEIGVAVEQDLIVKGFTDGIAGAGNMDPAEMQTLLQSLQQAQQAAHAKKQQVDSEKAKGEGVAYLAANAKKDGIKTTESGLQYEVVSAGKGDKPTADDKVTVHYTGTLIDGTKFDSSVDRGQPATFMLKQVIKGWTEGVQLMTVGSKFRFYIPYDLAYGERGSAQIPPFSALIFDVELISIGEEKKEEKAEKTGE